MLTQLVHPLGEPSSTQMVSLGARGDSYYEYLLKAWLQTGREDARLRARYDAAVGAVLAARPTKNRGQMAAPLLRC